MANPLKQDIAGLVNATQDLALRAAHDREDEAHAYLIRAKQLLAAALGATGRSNVVPLPAREHNSQAEKQTGKTA